MMLYALCLPECRYGARSVKAKPLRGAFGSLDRHCAPPRFRIQAKGEKRPLLPSARAINWFCKLDFSAFEGSWGAFVSERLAYFRLKRTKSIAPVATAAR